MDDYRLERRRSIRSLLFGKSSFRRRFESSPVNSFPEKNDQAEAILRRSSSHGGDSVSSEGTSSQGSVTSKRWKSPLVRSFSWIKWNFMSSLSNNYHPSHPPSFKISSSSLFNRKHEISSCYEKIKLCVESGMKMIAQRKSGFEYLEKNFDEMTVKENIEAELCKAAVNCSSPASNSEDIEEFEGLCCGSENKLEDREEEKCGENDDVEEGFEKQGFHGCPTEEHVWYRKKQLRHFPPPLPSLARTGNLPCHMPWVHLRSYKRDGRLIIQEVKVQHHEFFRAERSNGRLILHLVQHDEGKIRADQAEKIKVKPHRTGIDPPDQDSVDQAEENDRIETEEAPGETKDALVQNSGDKDGAKEALDESLGLLHDDNGDKDTVIEEEEIPEFNGEVAGLNSYGVQDKFSANFSIGEKEARLPDPVRIPVQQRFPAIGLESPVGCCAPAPNSLFGIPITAIRPIRS